MKGAIVLMDISFLWPVLMLAMAISVDGFSVGVTYGMRGIKIAVFPLLIIGTISTLSIFLTSSIGIVLTGIMTPGLGEKIGSIILIGIGFWLVYSAYISYNGTKAPSKNNSCNEHNNIEKKNRLKNTDNNSKRDEKIKKEEEILLFLHIKSFGLIIKILKEPVRADFDKSGTTRTF